MCLDQSGESDASMTHAALSVTRPYFQHVELRIARQGRRIREFPKYDESEYAIG